MAIKNKNKKEAKKASVDAKTKKSSGTKEPKVKEEKGRAGMGTVLRNCTCASEFQDRTYGRGIRVFNVGGTRESPKYSCTVCRANK